MVKEPVKSLRGIPYQRIIVWTFGPIALILIIIGLSIYFGLIKRIGGADVLLIAPFIMIYQIVILLFLFPDTVQIELLDQGIRIKKSRKVDFVEYSNIKDVTHERSTHFNGYHGSDIYRCEFRKETQFGHYIHFRCNGSWFRRKPKEPDLGKVLLSRARWASHEKH